jgi:hypothetical protein
MAVGFANTDRHSYEQLSSSVTMIESATVPSDFFDPTPERQIIVLIDSALLRKAERLI